MKPSTGLGRLLELGSGDVQASYFPEMNKKVNLILAGHGTVVEGSTGNPKIEGLSPTTGNGSEKIQNK